MQPTIQQVAVQNETSKAIFDRLAERQRYRTHTNLEKLHNELMNGGKKIVENDFKATFKKLQELGVGSLVIGRGVSPDRFIWNYNLKEIAKLATKGGDTENLSKLVETKKTLTTKPKLGRPFGSKSKQASNSNTEEGTIITIKLSPKVRNEDIKSLIQLIKGLEA